jgi:erythromycin esterase-like protein
MDHIENQSIRLEEPRDLDSLIDAIGDARFVLLGEASHGTSEFYTWRRELSKRLIEEKGFHCIAVEGDWPPCYEVNRYVKGYVDKKEEDMNASQLLVDQFQRWPSWMWANEETANLVEWLKQYNKNQTGKHKVGFYGIDVYSLWESIEEVINYLEAIGSEQTELAKKAYSCFEPYDRDPQVYGMNASFFSESCEQEVVDLLLQLQERRTLSSTDEESSLSTEMNALVAVNAERYYRSMVRGGPESWNIRDHHMVESIQRVMDFYGPAAKVIVWEHNTHIGDARATDMVQDGMVNVGQLVREQYPRNDVFAVGFATYKGSVIAGSSWGAPLEKMIVPPAQPHSWEALLHQAGKYDKLLIFEPNDPAFKEQLGHRAIGVVYDPEYEQFGNYVPTSLSARYDALIFLDETRALDPLVRKPILT